MKLTTLFILLTAAPAFAAASVFTGQSPPRPAATPPAPTNVSPPTPANSPFTTLGSTPSGRTLFLKLPAQPTLESAITSSADAFAKLCDAKPTLTGGFADSQSKHRGGALFTASINHTPVHGWIFTSLAKDTASASIIFLANSAPQSESETLFAALPAEAKTHTFQFPDGSGTIELPEGWTTKSPSLGGILVVTGPARQTLLLNAILNMNTPNGRLVTLINQTYQMKLQNYNRMLEMQRQFGGRGNPPPNPGPPPDPVAMYPNLLFCPYCQTADEVVNTLLPIIRDKSRAAGQPWTQIDKVLESAPADPIPGIPNEHAGIVYLATTNHELNNNTWTARTVAHIDTWPVANGADNWSADFNQMSAPDETFDRDLPVMTDIKDSIKVDPQWFAQKQKSDSDAILRQGEAFHQQLMQQSRDFNAQQASNFNRFESQMNARSQARHDANSDFIEMIGGVRDVYDTNTGQMHSVDYYHVDGITNALNSAANDPNRFVQIPLRYER